MPDTETKSAKGAYVSDLKVKIGEPPYLLQLAVIERSMRLTAKGKPYLALVLADRTGCVDGRVWDKATEWVTGYEPGDVIKLKATLEEWEGQRQLKITQLRKCEPIEYDRADFVPTTPCDIENLWSSLQATICDVKDKALQELLFEIVSNHAGKIREAPAAMLNHHQYRGGLLEHLVSMLQVVDLLCQHYTRLNPDLLISGVILHDIGKLEELKLGLTVDYTDEGRLVNHVALGLLILERAIDQYNDERYSGGKALCSETVTQLRHMIVSHHGRPEWGAVVEPMTPEAIALHCIDLMDTRLFACFAALDKIPAGESFSQFERGHRYYRAPEESDADNINVPDGDGQETR